MALTLGHRHLCRNRAKSPIASLDWPSASARLRRTFGGVFDPLLTLGDGRCELRCSDLLLFMSYSSEGERDRSHITIRRRRTRQTQHPDCWKG